MIVFKAFLKVLNKNKFIIILYTVLLLVFGGFYMQTNDTGVNFVASKPDILIINNDEEQGITQNLVTYLEEHCNIVNVEVTEDAINDALFYRDVNYTIFIPENYRKDFLNHQNPKIQVKGTQDYEAHLAEMILKRYLKVADIYNEIDQTETEMIEHINTTLSKQTKVEMTSKLDSDHLSKAVFYYNFANYSLLAGCIYVIGLILSSFKRKSIRKRSIISSMNEKEYNRKLLLANGFFTFALWFLYVLFSFILLKDIMFTMHGVLLILNSFIFTFCILTLAFLIGNLVRDKNALNGIVNVVALGSSFLCGAFVPMKWLPDFVLNIAHICPSYYYIKSNELLTTLEVFNLTTMHPIFINMLILLLFAVVFIVLTNWISNKKRQLD